MTNWNQMAVQFADWTKDKQFVEPMSVNTFRNIERRATSPRASTLQAIAEFLEVPVYALLIDGAPDKPDLIMVLNALVAAFVNGDEATRDAIRHMLSAFSAAKRPQAASF